MTASLGEREIVKVGERRLAYDIAGDAAGLPVFLLHGTPGSRTGPRPRTALLYRLGIRLISYDRPGYGGSDRDPGRRVGDAADDVVAIADELGVREFAVVGRSGGGPHALAVAAAFPARVIRAAVLVSMAPADEIDLNWYEGMNDQNREAYGKVDRDDEELFARLRASADQARDDPEQFIHDLLPDLDPRDQRIVHDVALRRMLLDTYQEALVQGAEGWIDDIRAFRSPWKVELGDIQCPVKLWHGRVDRYSPTYHTRWLAQRIPTAEIELEPAAGHFEAMTALPRILSWIRDGRTELAPVRPLPERARAASRQNGSWGSSTR